MMLWLFIAAWKYAAGFCAEEEGALSLRVFFFFVSKRIVL